MGVGVLGERLCKAEWLVQSCRKTSCRDFPGSPGAWTPRSQYREPGFDTWSGN